MNERQAVFNSSFRIPHSSLNPPPDSLARLARGERAAEVSRRLAPGDAVADGRLDGAGRVRVSQVF
jgi:hypothetical protein